MRSASMTLDEPVRDDQRGTAHHQAFQRLLNEGLVLGIDV